MGALDDECRGPLAALRSALDASGMVGTWDWNCVQRTARYDRGAAELLAHDGALAERTLHADAATVGIHPEDRKWLLGETQRAVEAGGLFLAEYRVVTQAGAIRWLLSRGRVYQDDVGRPVRATGILFDITESRDGSSGYLARTGGRDQHPLDRAASLLLDAQAEVDRFGGEGRRHLRIILDLALFEVGSQLAKRARH